jgi:hypothetical protein
MPYGTVQADVIQSSVPGVSLGAGNATVFKNRIINGDMRIDQRNAGASVTNTGLKIYSLDRWFIQGISSSKFTAQQNAGSVTPPAGFINYLGITSSAATSVGSGDYYFFGQSVEGLNIADLGWGTANAKTITISFWVRSSLTGTFGGALRNSAANRSYPFSYTISSANTWELETIVIAGDTSGTWLTTNGVGIDLDFNLGSGSTLSGTAGSWSANNYTSATGAVSVVGTNGATFYITGVQLEVGSLATGFEYNDYGRQLAQCQRYFFRKNVVSGEAMAQLQAYSSSAVFGKICDLPVTMRATPTGTLSAIGNFRACDTAGNPTAAFSTGSVDYLSTTAIGTGAFAGSSGLAAGNATVLNANTTAWIAASAEL